MPEVATSEQFASAGAGGKDSTVTGAFKQLLSSRKKTRDSGILDLSFDWIEGEAGLIAASEDDEELQGSNKEREKSRVKPQSRQN